MMEEDWELNFYWQRARHQLKDILNLHALPDLDMSLIFIGIRELGKVKTSWTKEDKQSLLHVAVCTLLESDGYYEFKGLDADGWPHWDVAIPFDLIGEKPQEDYLKSKIIKYLSSLGDEEE